MAGTFLAGDPTPLIVRQFVSAGTGGATNTRRHGIVTVSVPIPQSTVGTASTANNIFLSWVNPEKGTILVMNYTQWWSTTGTGTVDIGVLTDGTGSANDILIGGTMNATITSRRGRTGTQGGGTLGVAEWFALGPGGTGTNNSIGGKTNELTSTAVGRAIIQYIALDI